MTDNTNKPEPLDLKKLREKCAESDAILIETAKVRFLIAEVERLRDAYSGAMGDKRMWKMRFQALEPENARLKAALEKHGLLGEVEND